MLLLMQLNWIQPNISLMVLAYEVWAQIRDIGTKNTSREQNKSKNIGNEDMMT